MLRDDQKLIFRKCLLILLGCSVAGETSAQDIAEIVEKLNYLHSHQWISVAIFFSSILCLVAGGQVIRKASHESSQVVL